MRGKGKSKGYGKGKGKGKGTSIPSAAARLREAATVLGLSSGSLLRNEHDEVYNETVLVEISPSAAPL